MLFRKTRARSRNGEGVLDLRDGVRCITIFAPIRDRKIDRAAAPNHVENIRARGRILVHGAESGRVRCPSRR